MIPRKTKIICTIGPSTQSLESLTKLIETGMNTARLNFSHGSHDIHLQTLENIRKASKLTGVQISVLQDLQGPKIRTGKLENGKAELLDGAEFIITVDDLEYGNAQRVATVHKDLIREVKPGNTILLDDGYIILKVTKIEKNDIVTVIEKGGILKDNKGIIAPGVSSKAPSMSDKDLDDLRFGLQAGIDAVALSFVRSERDILELKAAMKIYGRRVPIVAKIERVEAVSSIDNIIQEADAIMVARGDLGLEMPAESVPIIQKEIINKCNYYGKPVIIATQMLESMISNPRPTRAEASDVANAVIDGADCVMLSGETSVGKYPLESVNYMHRIIKAVEDKSSVVRGYVNKEHARTSDCDISDALGKASCVIARETAASAIVTLTKSGFTALNIAKYRPSEPIIAIAVREEAFRRLTFTRGVETLLIPPFDGQKELFQEISQYLKKYSFLNHGDNLVFVTGLSAGDKVTPENMIKVFTLD